MYSLAKSNTSYRDLLESMWIGNTIKENNIKTSDENVNETERF